MDKKQIFGRHAKKKLKQILSQPTAPSTAQEPALKPLNSTDVKAPPQVIPEPKPAPRTMREPELPTVEPYELPITERLDRLQADYMFYPPDADLKEFNQEYVFVDEFYTVVDGTIGRNADGTDRQRVLDCCHVNDLVAPVFYLDKWKPACAIITKHGRIGNLCEEVARNIYAQYIDCVMCGVISEMTEDGCNIVLSFYRKK